MSIYSYPQVLVGQQLDVKFDVAKQEVLWGIKVLPELPFDLHDYLFGVPLDTSDFRPYVSVHTITLPNGHVAGEAFVGILLKSGHAEERPPIMPLDEQYLGELVSRFPTIREQVAERLAELGLPNDTVKLYLIGNFTT